MVRLGFVVGIVVPVFLLGVNLVLGYGGILVTAALIVWIRTAVILTPTSEERAQLFSDNESPPTDSSTHSSISRPSSRRTLTTVSSSSSTMNQSSTSSTSFLS